MKDLDARIINVENVSFIYDEGTQDALQAVEEMSFTLDKGQHIAILGRNGSGKSSLARLLNALLIPQEGNILVLGMNTKDEEQVWEIRSHLGMVFQNPDNQIVATTVEEDIAFGLENLGIAPDEIAKRVDKSLAYVSLSSMRARQPSELSGGQKQKLALAGILAMEPDCIILDEATAMLDPKSRRDLLRLLEEIRVNSGISVINVTHHMDEVLLADHVLVMSQGKLVLEGKPHEVFYQMETVKALGLDVPVHVELVKNFANLLERDLPLGAVLDKASSLEYLKQLLTTITEDEKSKLQVFLEEKSNDPLYRTSLLKENRNFDLAEDIVLVSNLSHYYNPDRIDTVKALSDVSFSLKDGEFLGIAGHTGSGKSTLIQHLNALIRVEEGSIHVLGYDVADTKNIPTVRRNLGMVFQYPEQQLFAETILDDVSYGPIQMGDDEEEAKRKSLKALELVGMDFMDLDRSPFELSGGQMRRIAIAGILAMEPKILVLDEPAAGLDPQGREEIFATMKALQEQGVSIIFVSHSMDDLAKLADRIMVLKEGKLQAIDSVDNIFTDENLVLENNLDIPQVMQYAKILQEIVPNLESKIFTEESLLYSFVHAFIMQEEKMSERIIDEEH